MSEKLPVETRKGKALEAGLRNMFKALARRPVPDHLRMVLEELEEAEAPAPRKVKAGR
jgi:hypothetical protein